jgi:type VI protein secretion system component Hcp
MKKGGNPKIAKSRRRMKAMYLSSTTNKKPIEGDLATKSHKGNLTTKSHEGIFTTESRESDTRM